MEEGGSATFRCELSKAGPAVEWRRGGDNEEVIEHGHKFHLRHRDAHAELKVLDVTPDDSNIYTCVCGTIETTATLTVNGGRLLLGLWSSVVYKLNSATLYSRGFLMRMLLCL